jgi:hypothetical protein
MRGEHVVGKGKGKATARAFHDGTVVGQGGLADQMGANLKANREGGTKEGLTFGSFNPDLEVPQSGTSIFDPVLCELSYRWFCPPGGHIIDPFAGGSVRGIVASCLGFHYTGVELRGEQVTANQQQAHIGTGPAPTWVNADSRNIATAAPGEYDMIFSCPPYADLEVYSDDPADLSTLEYSEFLPAYEHIIAETCALLKEDRFAVFVVGDARDKRGNYYGFPWHTIAAFQKAGLHLYNEAVLVTAAGSLPIRAGKQFRTSRKFGKTHQNVICMVKGDGKRAASACQAANDNQPAEVAAAA